MVGYYRVKDRFMAELEKSSPLERVSFKPRSSGEEDKFETCSHVRVLDDLPGPTVLWDDRESAEMARDRSVAPEVATTEEEIDPLDALARMGICEDKKVIQVAYEKSLALGGETPEIILAKAYQFILDELESQRVFKDFPEADWEDPQHKQGAGTKRRLRSSTLVERNRAQTEVSEGDGREEVGLGFGARGGRKRNRGGRRGGAAGVGMAPDT